MGLKLTFSKYPSPECLSSPKLLPGRQMQDTIQREEHSLEQMGQAVCVSTYEHTIKLRIDIIYDVAVYYLYFYSLSAY